MLALIAIGVYYLFDLSPVAERYVARFSASEGAENFLDSVTSGRISVWGRCLDDLGENIRFLTGYGINGGRTLKKAAHNTFIQMFYICGIIGVLLFAVWLHAWRKDIVRIHGIKKTKGFDWRSALFPFIVIVNLSSLDTFTWDYFYFMLALMMMSGVEKNDETADGHAFIPLRQGRNVFRNGN